jgi:hypothetical protein
MVSFAKAILGAVVGAVIMVLLTQFAFFFPFYMTIVVETFNLANTAAGDNYIKDSYYESSLATLQSKPMFKQNPNKIIIDVRNSDGGEAVGDDDEYVYNATSGESGKPYRQRGNPIVVTVSAAYPLTINIAGQTIEKDIDLSFTITTIGLKYYKDLDM